MRKTTRVSLAYRAFMMMALCLLMIPALSMAQTYYDNERQWSNNDESLNIRRSDHFRMIWGNGQNPQTSSEYNSVTEQMIQGDLQQFEHGWHTLFDPAPAGLGFRAPNESAKPEYRDGKFYRTNFLVNNSGIWEGGGWGSWDDWGFPQLGVNPMGLRYDPQPDASFHEYIHTVLINAGGFNGSPWDGEWHESTNDWLGIFFYWYAGMGNYSMFHNLSLTNGRCYYDSWLLPELLYEDPRYGTDYLVNLWTQAHGGSGEYMFDAMVRLHPAGEPDPTNSIKDCLGMMAARNVTWDYLGKQYYRITTPYVLDGSPFNERMRRGTTEPIRQPGTTNWYRVPFEHAPCQGGYSIIPIELTGKTTGGYPVSIDFQPLWDANRKSDWRACFVAVNNAGDARYSNMWNSGINTITLAADENKLFFVVAATPDFLPFDGAKGPLMTDPATAPQAYRIAFVNTTAKPYLMKLTKSGTSYHQHPNGGGMVANSATVDATAYVGPNALVYDTAKVLGYARIEDYAQVLTTAQVRDNAVVSGHAVVKDQAQVYGNAKVRDWAMINNNAKVYENARVTEHAYLAENVQVHGNATIKGCAMDFGTADSSGCAIKDADCSNYANITKGVLMGWVWGANTDRVNALADNQYLYCGYDFDKTSPIYALDKYGITYGYLMGNPQVVNGGATNRGSVLSLNGTDQYVELHNDASDFRDSTVAVWAKWTGSANDQRIWSFGDGANKYMYLTPKDTSTGNLRLVVTNGTTTQYLDGTSPLSANTWTHIAVTFSGSTYNTTTKQWIATATLYVNGVAVTSGTGILVPDQCNGANAADAGNWNFIGRGNAGDYFAGQIDEFRVYCKALTAGEVSALQTLAGGTVSTTSDTTAPAPNAATWLVAPTTIGTTAVTMSATKGTDASNYVEYYFTCTAGGGHDSGWISNNKYFDSSLTPGTTYTYTVKMRDKAGNITATSTAQSVTLPSDTAAPTPTTATFALAPKGISTTAIRMTATKGVDASPMVEYKFNRYGTSVTSGWQTSPVWTDTGLTSGTTYSYTVQMRDAYGNTGTVSSAVSAVATDQTPPTRYEYGEWCTMPYATIDNCIAMRARSVTGSDILSANVAGESVQYYFHCTSGNGPDSGWIDTNVWQSAPLPDGTYSYQFKIRDKSTQLNETPYSAIKSGSITPKNCYHNYTLSQLSGLSDEYLVSFNGTVVRVNSNGYVVKDPSSSSSITVKTKYAGDPANLFATVNVKGAIWTYSGTKKVTFATVTSTGGPATYTVSGKVTDTSGAAISGATVYFSDVPNASVNPVTTVTTDASGNYSKALPTGTTWYVAAKGGAYNVSADRTVTINGANVANIDFSLVENARVIGRVVKKSDGTPISGASVYFSTTPNATVNPAFTATTDASGNYTQPVQNGNWYICASGSGYYPSPDMTVTVSGVNVANVTLALTANTRNIPRTGDLLFSAVTESLPSVGSTGNWATYSPPGQTLTAIGTPAVEAINNIKWEKNLYTDGDGYRLGQYSSPIPVNGASIVAVIKPTRSSDTGTWRSIVDIFFDRLILGIANNTGLVYVRRNGSYMWSPTGTAIPDGQITILSLVVQPDGTYKVYANGTQIVSNTTTSAMTALTPGVAGAYATYINVGRNNPDSWSIYNGNIGDVFCYKVALSDAERLQLEADLTNKFRVTSYTINAVAGPGGTISPSGLVTVNTGSSCTFTITPNTGSTISSVIVDGVNVGAVSSYTFPSVSANHTITASFATSSFTINASAGTGGTISPSGAVPVNSGASQMFTITPNAGYYITDVVVDGTSVGAVTSHTFPNVTANHTIAASFANDLRAYWKFDETTGTSAADSSGNGKTATLNGSCTWVAGKTGNAVSIPGGTSYVGVPAGIVDGLTNFSVAGWVKLTTVDAQSRIFDFGTSTSNYMMMTPRHLASNGKYRFAIVNGGTTQSVTGPAALAAGTWQHVAVTLSGTTCTLYLNGAQVARVTNMTKNPSTLGSTTKNYIGDAQTLSHPHINGLVDGFRIYNRALSGTEISNLYGGGAGPASAVVSAGSPLVDLKVTSLEPGVLSEWKNTGTAGGIFRCDGTAPMVETIDGVKAVTFTGADWMAASFKAPSTITGSHAFTTSIWAYRPEIDTDQTILSWATNARVDASIAPAEGWHLLTVSYDKRVLKFYVDGVLIRSERRSLNTRPGMPVILGAAYTTSGSTYYPTLNFTGSIGSVRIYDKALSQTDIVKIYKAGF